MPIRYLTKAVIALFFLVGLGGEAPSAQTTTRIRLVHGSAALADLGPIDVFVNSDPATDDPDMTLTFQNADVEGSPVLEVPAGPGQPLRVTARLQNPPQIPGIPSEVTFEEPDGLPPGDFFVTLAGVPEALAPLYAPNPEQEARVRSASGPDFNIFFQLILAYLQSWSGSGAGRLGAAADVPTIVSHAVTDAPLIDVVLVESGQVLADDLRFGLATQEPVLVAPGTYTVNVLRSADGELLEQSRLTVTGTEGAVQFTATGFLDPSQNAPFGGSPPPLAMVGVDGTTGAGVVAQPTAAESAVRAPFGLRVFPSPARSATRVEYALASPALVRLGVYDVLGRRVGGLVGGHRAAGSRTELLDLSGFAPGPLFVRLEADGVSASVPLMVVR